MILHPSYLWERGEKPNMLKDIGTMLRDIDPLLGVIGILLGVVVAIVFFILGLRAHRPKLIAGVGAPAQSKCQGKTSWLRAFSFTTTPPTGE